MFLVLHQCLWNVARLHIQSLNTEFFSFRKTAKAEADCNFNLHQIFEKGHISLCSAGPDFYSNCSLHFETSFRHSVNGSISRVAWKDARPSEVPQTREKTIMFPSGHLAVLVGAFLMGLVHGQNEACQLCRCMSPKTVNCSYRGLTSVPHGIPNDTAIL